MTDTPDPLKSTLQKIFEKLETQKNISEDALLDVWMDAVGDKAYHHARPTSLREGLLRVSVDSAGWLQELTMKKRQILKKLQYQFGKDRISDIRFKTNSIS